MLITFLAILFSDLSFTNLSIQELLSWYNCHPFILILAIQDVILGALVLFRLFNELTAITRDFEEDEHWTYINE